MSVKITIGYTLVQLSLARLIDRTILPSDAHLRLQRNHLNLQKEEEGSDG